MRWGAVLALMAAACGEPGEATPDAAGNAASVDGPSAPTAAELLARLASCNQVGGEYATDSGGAPTIGICGLPGAVFWTADLDIDCDGKVSAQCNTSTDPSFENQTSATDSHGDPLDAATLPYVVIPLPSSRFDYAAHGLALGSVVALIYHEHVEYGVLGDEGPSAIIGEASYRMAQLLGIDPDPSTGGADSGVSYIAFTGAGAVVPVIEDHDMAVQLGITSARAMLASP